MDQEANFGSCGINCGIPPSQGTGLRAEWRLALYNTTIRPLQKTAAAPQAQQVTTTHTQEFAQTHSRLVRSCTLPNSCCRAVKHLTKVAAVNGCCCDCTTSKTFNMSARLTVTNPSFSAASLTGTRCCKKCRIASLTCASCLWTLFVPLPTLICRQAKSGSHLPA